MAHGHASACASALRDVIYAMACSGVVVVGGRLGRSRVVCVN